MKSLNLENWCNGDFQCQFSTSKIIQIFLNFIFIEEYECRSKFFCYWHFLITPIFKSLYFLKWCLIFDSLPLLKFSQVNNLIWIQSFFSQDLSNFISLPWKLHNRYCHSIKLSSSFLVFWLDCFLSYSINWWHLTRTI